jgi:hypothetical protein
MVTLPIDAPDFCQLFVRGDTVVDALLCRVPTSAVVQAPADPILGIARIEDKDCLGILRSEAGKQFVGLKQSAARSPNSMSVKAWKCSYPANSYANFVPPLMEARGRVAT